MLGGGGSSCTRIDDLLPARSARHEARNRVTVGHHRAVLVRCPVLNLEAAHGAHGHDVPTSVGRRTSSAPAPRTSADHAHPASSITARAAAARRAERKRARPISQLALDRPVASPRGAEPVDRRTSERGSFVVDQQRAHFQLDVAAVPAAYATRSRCGQQDLDDRGLDVRFPTASPHPSTAASTRSIMTSARSSRRPVSPIRHAGPRTMLLSVAGEGGEAASTASRSSTPARCASQPDRSSARSPALDRSSPTGLADSCRLGQQRADLPRRGVGRAAELSRRSSPDAASASALCRTARSTARSRRSPPAPSSNASPDPARSAGRHTRVRPSSRPARRRFIQYRASAARVGNDRPKSTCGGRAR